MATIQLRRSTTTALAKASTVVLAAGEPAVALDTGEIRVGNGTQTWKDLPPPTGLLVLDLRAQTGVVGDGTADDTAAINTAAASAASLGARLFAKGVFKISGTVTLNCDTDLTLATFNYTGAGTAVQVGGVAVLFRKIIALPKIIYTPKSGTGWTASTVGVKALNLNGCIVTVPHIRNFETGLNVRGEAQGNSYCTYHVGHLDNNKRNLVLNADGTGWSNQNTYVGGRYGHESAEGTDVAGARHILLEQAANPVNGNVWLNPSVEGSAAEQQIDTDGGSYNQWLNPRLERSGGGRVRWGSAATANMIVGGYNTAAALVTRVTGESRNVLRAINQFDLYGSSSVAVARLQNTSSDAAYTLALYGAASVADADWRWRWSAQQLEAKRTAETGARVILDGNNGRLYLGTGGAAPAMYWSATSTSGLTLNGGHLYSGTDNTYDIGLISSLRYRYVRAGTAVVTGAGTTRPAAATAGAGAMFFDTTLGKPIWSTGSAWVDATGATV